ncbi:MAG TPA: hypothetical protein VJN43_22385 [Bryobacteraceae bacterium]|nr:hypothetical protein [Bryobacteraceae bacterium]
MPRKTGIQRATDAWRLPSGKRLAEFALASGFLTPQLLEKLGERRPEGRK